MIKKLSLKFVLVFLVLVVSVFITSSCYAAFTEDNVTVVSLDNYNISLNDVYDYMISQDSNFLSTYNNGVVAFLSGDSEIRFVFFSNASEISSLALVPISNESVETHRIMNDGSSSKYAYIARVYYNFETNTFSNYLTNQFGDILKWYSANGKFNFNVLDCTSYNIYFNDVNGSLLYEPSRVSVIVSHEFQSDTSAKVVFDYSSYGTDYILQYSLSGVEVNSDLTAPIKLRNPVTYSPLTNLIVKPNTKVYWVLYDSNNNFIDTNVYQVPEYDVVVENADKNIEYELKYSDDYTSAVLTATLKNGEFSDKLVYSEFPSLNISTGKLDYGYQNFNGSLKIVTNGKYYIYAIDIFGNVFDTEIIVVSNIFNFKDSDFSYTIENNSTLHGGHKLNITPIVKSWSSKVDIYYHIELTPGVFLDNVFVDTEYPDLSYVDNNFGSQDDLLDPNASKYFTGRIMSGDTIQIIRSESKLHDLKGNITFKIYKKSDNSLIYDKTFAFNINSFSVGNIADGSSGSVSGSLPSDSENSEDFTYNDYGDVSWSDVEDYVGTSGSFWSIVKNILNNLPKWITAPIFFFISAVVAIALIKAILP